jgi:hypothetical protein
MKRDFSRCPRCGAPTKKPPSFAGPPSEFWLECTECNTFINTYIPQNHQRAVHEDDHRYKGNFGAYGTGKTLTSREEVEKHSIITDNGVVLIGANVTSQYEQTIKRELESDIPKAFVADSSNQKAYIDLINGTRILYRPFDDPDKLRSYNLTMFVILEASEVKAEAYHQLKTRLRNTNACKQAVDENGNLMWEEDEQGQLIPIFSHDWRRGIVESNPDAGWIRTDLLMNASEIQKHGRVMDEYTVPDDKKDPAISVHVASTDVNRYLPKSFIDEQVKNKPTWWVARYIYASFAYAEGLVYPSAMKHIVPTFSIPTDWKRLAAFDYGLTDDAVFHWAAIDEKAGICYIYKEERVNNRNIDELVKIFKAGCADIPIGGWAITPLIDPKSGPKRDYHKKSLIDLFGEQGCVFQPGYVNVDARLMRMNTYLESGRLKIMDCCRGTIDELREYKFKPRSLSRDIKDDKPEDKNNHGINCIEWMCMALPADPRRLVYGVFNKFGTDITQAQLEHEAEGGLPFALTDEEDLQNKRRSADYAYGIEQGGGWY